MKLEFGKAVLLFDMFISDILDDCIRHEWGEYVGIPGVEVMDVGRRYRRCCLSWLLFADDLVFLLNLGRCYRNSLTPNGA